MTYYAVWDDETEYALSVDSQEIVGYINRIETPVDLMPSPYREMLLIQSADALERWKDERSD